jgi:Flp pilus assembly protein protease CpaA
MIGRIIFQKNADLELLALFAMVCLYLFSVYGGGDVKG